MQSINVIYIKYCKENIALTEELKKVKLVCSSFSLGISKDILYPCTVEFLNLIAQNVLINNP